MAENIIKASPAAKRLAKENNIDLRDVTPTSPMGTVRLQDVEEFLEKNKKTPVSQVQTQDNTDNFTDPIQEIYNLIKEERNNPQKENAPKMESPLFFDNPQALTPDYIEEKESPSVQPTEKAEEENTVSKTEDSAKPNNEETQVKTGKNYEPSQDTDYPVTPIPVYTSFSVSDRAIKQLLTGMKADAKEKLIDVIVKSCAAALRRIDFDVYEDYIRLLYMTDENFHSKIAYKADETRISEIKYLKEQDIQDHVSINIWDMTKMQLNSMKCAQIDRVNIFALWSNDKITIEISCDEYVMDMTQCIQFSQVLQKFLINPSYMLY